MRHTSLAATLSACALVVACGARSDLDGRQRRPGAGDAGPGVGAGGTSSGGTLSSGGAGGQGGAPQLCETLVWAGQPVTIGVAAVTGARRPRLIKTSPSTVALVYELPASGFEAELFSVELADPFGAWPTEPGENEVHFPLVGRAEVSAGATNEVAFATVEPGSSATILGDFEPGQNGATFVQLPFFAEPHFLTNSPSASFLLGEGADTFGRVHWVSAMVAEPLINTLGSIGCADEPIAVEAVSNGDETFWVANTSDMPNDDCADPDAPGPPLFASLWRAEPSSLTPVAAFEGAAVLTEIDVASRDETVWVGVDDAANQFTVWRFTSDEEDILALPPSQVDATYDLGAIVDKAIVAQLIPSSLQPGGDLRVLLLGPDGEVASLSSQLAPPFAESEPSVLVDGDKALIAWADDIGSLFVSRADCIPLLP